jgi:Domain of unknown function (DUF4198)
MRKVIQWLALALAFLSVTAASAHEFWIESQSPSAADIRVGQMLSGQALPYLDTIIRSARHFPPDGAVESLTGRLGDLPALAFDLAVSGMHLITVETQPAYIVFDDLREFDDYLAYEGLQSVSKLHWQRGLPPVKIAEEYLRYARSLVQVGPPSAEDADRPVGLRFELVALQSPFLASTTKVELQLLWEGSPHPNAQIAMFHKASSDGTVTRVLLQGDGKGKATADVQSPGLYVFNAVQILPADGPGNVVWQSHWASLSFMLTRESMLD